MGTYKNTFGVVFGTLVALSFFSAHAATSVGGTLTGNNTWTLANSPYIVTTDVSFFSPNTLAIEPGVVVKFKAGKQMNAYGTLTAIGTITDNIVFTSDDDDSYGGDTNGTATAPVAGVWRGINLGANPASQLENVRIRYPLDAVTFVNGYGTGATLKNSILENGTRGISLTASSPTIIGNTFSGFSGDAVFSNNGGDFATIVGNTITGNGRGVNYISAVKVFSGNTVTGNINSSLFPNLDGLLDGNPTALTYDRPDYRAANFTITPASGNISKKTFDIVLVLPSSPAGLGAGKNLSISAGNIFKVQQSSTNLVPASGLVVNGTPSERVIFTSYNDKSVGETTLPGATGTPTNDWGGLGLGGDTASRVDYARIRYTGNTAAISFNNGYGTGGTVSNSILEYGSRGVNSTYSSPRIVNNTLSGFTIEGISVNNGGNSAIITGNTITGNGKGVTFSTTIASVFSGNTITGNSNYSTFPNLDGILDGNPGGNIYDRSDYRAISMNITPTSGTISKKPFDIVVTVGNSYPSTLAAGKTLNISGGNIFKMAGGVSSAVAGTLLVNGNAAERVVFTSYNDNTVGQALGSGSPTPDWAGFTLSNTSKVNYARIRYATVAININSTIGATISNNIIENGSQGIVGYNTTSSVLNNTLSNFTTEAMNFNNNGGATVKNNLFYANTIGIKCLASTPTIKYNMFYGNSTADASVCSIAGSGNITGQAPQFSVTGSYMIAVTSPARNAGDPTMGNHPISGDAYDIGAQEYFAGTNQVMNAIISNPTAKALTYQWTFSSYVGPTPPAFVTSSTGATSATGGTVSATAFVRYYGNYTATLTVLDGATPYDTQTLDFTVAP